MNEEGHYHRSGPHTPLISKKSVGQDISLEEPSMEIHPEKTSKDINLEKTSK
jgi:hypothetical protein